MALGRCLQGGKEGARQLRGVTAALLRWLRPMRVYTHPMPCTPRRSASAQRWSAFPISLHAPLAGIYGCIQCQCVT